MSLISHALMTFWPKQIICYTKDDPKVTDAIKSWKTGVKWQTSVLWDTHLVQFRFENFNASW